ncbi:MAG: hypothetical protein AB9907_14755 [Flexilinea sp.]
MEKGAKTIDYEHERERLEALFAEADETKRELLEGLIDESAKCRVELQRLCSKRDNLVSRGAPWSVTAPIDSMITKIRASYTNISTKLCRLLLEGNDEEIDIGLEGYE